MAIDSDERNLETVWREGARADACAGHADVGGTAADGGARSGEKWRGGSSFKLRTFCNLTLELHGFLIRCSGGVCRSGVGRLVGVVGVGVIIGL